ncbi:hypothetical protein [Mucilaginibacter sp. L196]|uniref:hypothetical protein n=1 Tax=Mucilaginibacter sp. L196 TaxID=1641870 RepID=UPI00131B10BE|nr:hypothetical protein [Mucilaginibacter sp. L196]
MQVSAKILNKSLNWSALLKVRVGTVVTGPDGNTYINTSGVNSVVTITTNWQFIAGVAGLPPINLTASAILGADPNFYVSLSAYSVPAFPKSISAYVDSAGTGAYVLVSPLQYDPVNMILSGLDSPTDFPNQQIMIVVS